MLRTWLRRRGRGVAPGSWPHVLLYAVLGVLLLDTFLIAFGGRSRVKTNPVDYINTHPPLKIFIASTHRNNEKILRSHWNNAVEKLARYFGPSNVYVSIYESGSIDETKDALRELDVILDDLKVPRTIVLDEHDQIEEVGRKVTKKQPGWIWTSQGKFELRRIPYLANLRNDVMSKLYEQEKKGIMYDVVLWLNDVVFTTEDITTLLATRDGAYSAVCSLDFNVSSIYYDTFALRDSNGHKALPGMWPFFQSSASRNALLRNQPVPVQSCWNGITLFKAAPFYANQPLMFRGIEDSLAEHHLEGSECCLVHADMKEVLEEEGEPFQGVWLNPNVRVAYKQASYVDVNPIKGGWPSAWQRLSGFWTNRISRWTAWPKRWLERGTVSRRVRKWTKEDKGNHEPGAFCLINEMHVLFQAGWRHR